MFYRLLQQVLHPDVAIDLGTATTRVAFAHRPLTLNAPSLCGNMPALRAGVIVDPGMAGEVLSPAIARLRRLGITRPRALACAPSDTTREERAAVLESCYRAGVGAAALVPEPLAAAVGAGLDLLEDRPLLVMDIGEGVTDCALIRSCRIVATHAARVACADLHFRVQSMLRDQYGVVVSAAEARRITESVGVASSLDPVDNLPLLRFETVAGTARYTSVLMEENVPVGMIHEALQPITKRIIATLTDFLADLSSEERNAVQTRGIYVTGGGSLLPGMISQIAAITGKRTIPVRNPLGAVVDGAKVILPSIADSDLWRPISRR